MLFFEGPMIGAFFVLLSKSADLLKHSGLWVIFGFLGSGFLCAGFSPRLQCSRPEATIGVFILLVPLCSALWCDDPVACEIAIVPRARPATCVTLLPQIIFFGVVFLATGWF